jgi:hypothetical protein
MDIRDFTSDEIAAINSYVLDNIPNSKLPQLFVLTEEPIKKIRAFISIYRIISGCNDFMGKEETKDKITSHLNEIQKSYDYIYPLLLNYDLEEMEMMKSIYLKKIVRRMLEDNDKLNYFINTFLVFSEKQQLYNVDTVSGVKLETPEGEDLYEKLSQKV